MRLWERVFARGYDVILGISERGGLTDTRRALLAAAKGRTLEIGAGTGLNARLYPTTVGELVLAEPAPPMVGRLEARVERDRPEATVFEAPAEDLPFRDHSFDTVVSTFVLCSVDSVPGALDEVARVLRPGGRFLFLEHVRASDPALARWQHRLAKPWRALACGCRCDQDTLSAIAQRLEVACVDPYHVPRAPALVRSAILGSATTRA